MKYKLIIFDCDGVLVDSESITTQVLVDYLNEFGAPIKMNEALELFQGGTLQESIEYVEKTFGIKLPKEFSSNFRYKIKVAFERDLKPVEGVVEVIEKIKIPICIASNGPKEKMETTLKVTGLARFFGENIFSAYDIQKWKPEPDLFLYAAKSMNVKPKDCAVIEDSPRGVKAAKLAGMDAYGFDNYGKSQELTKEGALLFKKMADLPPLLQNS